MRDFVLEDGFLGSCIHLPEGIRRKIVSQLRSFTKSHRHRVSGVARVEGSKDLLSLPVEDACRIILRRETPATALLVVTENDFPSALVSRRGATPDHRIMGSVDAIETLLVEGKYLALATSLLQLPAATKEIQFQFAEIERILNAHLPPEARRFLNWWANQKSGKRAHAFAWMASGWLVAKVDIDRDVVKFVRGNRKVEEVV